MLLKYILSRLIVAIIYIKGVSMYNIFNEIFGQDVSHIFQHKETLKRQAIQSYIDGRITKKQLDDKMEQLNRD